MLKSHSNKGGSVGVNMNRVKKAFQKRKSVLALPAPPKNNGIGKKSKNNKLNSVPTTKPTTKSSVYESNNNNEPFKKKTSNPLFQTFPTTNNPIGENNQPKYKVGNTTINPLFKPIKRSSKNKVAGNRERAKRMGISVKRAKKLRPRS